MGASASGGGDRRARKTTRPGSSPDPASVAHAGRVVNRGQQPVAAAAVDPDTREITQRRFIDSHTV